jgi:regulator of nonsense transcripts 2
MKLNSTLNLFKKCLDDFNQNNIYVACHLLETCGRFLNFNSETHESFKILLETMMRFKNVKSFDVKYNIMIESAFYSCFEEKENQDDTPSIQKYYSFIIHDELNKQNYNKILKKMRKFNWERDFFLIGDIMRDSTKCKYSTIPLLASLIGGISMIHEFLSIYIIDSIFEDLRLFLCNEMDFSFQKILFDVKLLSELFVHNVIDSKMIFDSLYIILNYSTIKNDSPQDTFRITLILTILDTTYPQFKSIHLNSKLDVFLIHFQHYILSKQIRLPVTVEMNLADVLEEMRPNLVWPKNFNESFKIIEQLNSSFFISETSIPSLKNNNLIWEIKKDESFQSEQEEDRILREIKKSHIVEIKKENGLDVEKANKKLLEEAQFDRELQQLMEESTNERKKENLKKSNENPKIFILKK